MHKTYRAFGNQPSAFSQNFGYRLSRNSARTGRAIRLGLLLPIPLASRVAARALGADY
jgi:hypothetical protein